MAVDITAPAPGILLIDAGADFHHGPQSLLACWIEIGNYYFNGFFFVWSGATIDGSVRYSELNGGGGDNGEEDCSTEIGINVAAGTHTLRFFTNALSGVTIGSGAMTVLWVPYDGDGGVPIPLP